jgi:hypothetical protein
VYEDCLCRRSSGCALFSNFLQVRCSPVVQQQMRWRPRGTHLLLRVRTRVPNDGLAGVFRRWYPAFSYPGDGER